MTNLFLLLTLFSGLTHGLSMHENVIFHKANEIALTRSKWLFTFVIDLVPYEQLLNKLSLDVHGASATFDSIRQHYDHPEKQGFLNVFKGLEKEINSLRSNKVYVIESYIGYLAIQGRLKKSLIPIVGKAVGYLFGTATEGDIKAIQRNIKRLAQNQEEIAHVVDESISVINITRIELDETDIA